MIKTTSDELYKAAAEVTAKYVYFLLAATGASVAYSTQAANSAIIAWPLLFLILAICAWGYSFFAGCKHLQCSISTYNIQILMRNNNEIFDNITVEAGQQEKFYDAQYQLQHALEPQEIECSAYLGMR
ncbi:hypothetical protein [Aquaspirillum sp. LM1]|uniref:hypothetical protein n=1 Tax=Aquaspirillum sp. LM1 TaxID=1938604 RepID=UPI0012372D5A|nr:hypothetical protein [Aquaspirillum sp. LM1]